MKKLLFFALIAMVINAFAQNYYGYSQPVPVPYQTPCVQQIAYQQPVIVQQGYSYSNGYANQYPAYQNTYYVNPYPSNGAGFNINTGNFSMSINFSSGYSNNYRYNQRYNCNQTYINPNNGIIIRY